MHGLRLFFPAATAATGTAPDAPDAPPDLLVPALTTAVEWEEVWRCGNQSKNGIDDKNTRSAINEVGRG